MKLHIHWDRFVISRGANDYWECRCGHRQANKAGRGWTPFDRSWLEGGDWSEPPSPPSAPIGLPRLEPSVVQMRVPTPVYIVPPPK